MNPTERMVKNIELPGIIADDPQALRKPMSQNASQQSPFGGHLKMAWLLNLKGPQMGFPERGV